MEKDAVDRTSNEYTKTTADWKIAQKGLKHFVRKQHCALQRHFWPSESQENAQNNNSRRRKNQVVCLRSDDNNRPTAIDRQQLDEKKEEATSTREVLEKSHKSSGVNGSLVTQHAFAIRANIYLFHS